jgi:conjugative transfer signal peptidase TraF
MKPFIRKIAAGISLAGVGVIALGLVCYAVGARVNTSKSIPLGLYWTSDKPVEKGAYVLFCPPQVGVIAEAKRRGYLSAGFCPGDYGYLMKRILAAKGDHVTIAGDGVRVNGELLPHSAPLAQDGAGRPLPRFQAGDFVIGNTEVLLMSDVSSKSFDGRYIGPIGHSQIQTVIVPVLTW